MDKKEFNNGLWIAIQFLVISHKENELAKQLIKETGLSKEQCFTCQMESDFENEIMYDFINSIYK